MPLMGMEAGAALQVYGFTSGAPVLDQYVFVGTTVSQISAYPWNDTTGFGTRYATPSGIANDVADIATNATNTYVFATSWGSPFVYAWPFSKASGFGAKLSDPATLPPNVTRGVAVRTGVVAVAHNSYPFMSAYSFTTSWGTKFADPSTPPDSTGYKVDWNAAGNFIVGGFARASSTNTYAWSWSSGFGTRIDNTNYVINNNTAIKFNPAGNVVAVGGDGSPFLAAYPFTTTWGTKFADPANLPVYPLDLGWHPQGNAVVTNVLGSPQIAAFPFNAGWGTRFANPGTLPAGTGWSAKFSKSGRSVAVAHSTSPYVTAYAWSAGFGTKFADPAVVPNAQGNALAFA